MRALILGL